MIIVIEIEQKKQRVTVDIPVHYTVCLSGLAAARKRSLPRRTPSILDYYDTPTEQGKKWQMDVKYVPIVCYVGTDGEKFYQYTMNMTIINATSVVDRTRRGNKYAFQGC